MKAARNIIIWVLLCLHTSLLLAEGILLKGVPEDGAKLSRFDGQISLWFSGNVSDRHPSIAVVNSKGQRIDNRDVRLTIGGRSQLQATTPNLPPDDYALRYRVVTEDGLVVSGVRKFSIIPQ